jgi:hypothetical protein
MEADNAPATITTVNIDVLGRKPRLLAFLRLAWTAAIRETTCLVARLN